MSFRADLVFTISEGRVVHIEIQQRPDPNMARRMLEYAGRLYARHPAGALRPGGLIQVVVQVTGSPMPGYLHTDMLDCRFNVVHGPTVPSALLLADAGTASGRRGDGRSAHCRPRRARGPCCVDARHCRPVADGHAWQVTSAALIG